MIESGLVAQTRNRTGGETAGNTEDAGAPRLAGRARAGVFLPLLAAGLAIVASSCCGTLESLVDPAHVVAPHRVDWQPPARVYNVVESSVVWHDAKRDRDVPAKFY
ncbi:MAG: hypothetical protein ABI837_09110, partial [Acidobacteriota bacterium]